MCWKKLFGGGGEAEEMGKVQLRLLTFGKNKYGGGNNLNGCVNDSYNLSNKKKKLWPEFDTRFYLNDDATAQKYLNKVSEAKKLLDPEAAIVIIMDSCFSGTGTRLYPLNPGKIKNRFFNPGLPRIDKIKSRIWRNTVEEMTWVAMSAGREDQTVADAYFNQYEGAFTHFLVKTLEKGMTLREWHNETRRFLPSLEFDQEPQIEGPDSILDRVIGEGQWLFVHNSSHGSWTYDKDGDELDGRDEGIYFDRLLIDDEINKLLRA